MVNKKGVALGRQVSMVLGLVGLGLQDISPNTCTPSLGLVLERARW